MIRIWLFRILWSVTRTSDGRWRLIRAWYSYYYTGRKFIVKDKITLPVSRLLLQIPESKNPDQLLIPCCFMTCGCELWLFVSDSFSYFHQQSSFDFDSSCLDFDIENWSRNRKRPSPWSSLHDWRTIDALIRFLPSALFSNWIKYTQKVVKLLQQ